MFFCYQMVGLGFFVGVEYILNGQGKVVLPRFIEEVPKHINGQKGSSAVKGSVVINKPLERFIVAVILDEIKHTALVGFKRR